MKREAIVLIIILAFLIILLLYSLGAFDLAIQLAPSQQAEARVQVGNVDPTINSMQAIPAVNLNPSPSSTTVTFTFDARDRNGASDLNDAAAAASFTRAGEQARTAQCSFLTQINSRERRYSCNVSMQYYDASGTWNVTVSTADQSESIGSGSSSFVVNLLKDITINPAIISFPTVAPGDGNITSSIPTTITNNGNFEAPSNGNIQITAFGLQGETNSAESIPAENFRAGAQASACSTGASMSQGAAIALTSNLPRGPSGSNTAEITHCITLVPDISTQSYSAKGGNSWLIGI